MNIISKIGTAPVSHTQKKGEEPVSPAPAPTQKAPNQSAVPPSLSTTALAGPGHSDTSAVGLSEQQLKRQGIECLVAVLKSLVVWGTAGSENGRPDQVPPEPSARSAVPDEMKGDKVTPESSSLDLRPGPTSADPTRQPTPEAVDDPSKFESAKQKKTTLLEGIKKFNFKPKRVRPYSQTVPARAELVCLSRASNFSSRLASFRATRRRTSPNFCLRLTV